jgi:uncharacterized protein
MVQACVTSQQHNHIGVMWKTVSESCNLACDYCYYSSCGGQPGKIDKIDSTILEKFIKEYMSLSNGAASFAWQGGEPLFAGLDFFKEVVFLQAKYAPKNTIISNSLQTNATLITDEWAKFFKQYNFLIGVSLDGPKEINDARRVTGHGMGSFDRVMRGIQYLRKNQVDYNILTVIHQDNVGRAGELIGFYQNEGFSHVQFIPCMDFRAQEPDRPGQYLITPEQYGQFLCEAFDIWYNEGNPSRSIRFFDNILSIYLNQEAELCIQRQTCPKTLILEQNGDAYPCDFYMHDDFKLGNIGQDSLIDILASPKYHDFLKLKPALPEKCKSCEYLKLCHGGCPRNRDWSQADNTVNPDYFCKSYMKVYAHGHERMERLAENIKQQWLQNHLQSGRPKPERNDLCLCGSGRKFKKCCEKFLQKV